MKLRARTLITAIFLFIAFGTTLNLAVQESQAQSSSRKHHHYRVFEIGTFGGPTSSIAFPPAHVLTERGTVVGWADSTIPDPLKPNCFNDECTVLKAFIWHDERLIDLPSLSSAANSYAIGENDRRWVIGVSETGSIDSSLGTPQYAGVVWRNGEIKDVGTLGGESSAATAVNNLGEVVGGASNGKPDQQSMLSSDLFIFGPFPANTQSRAFLWKGGLLHDLGTLGGPDSMAIFNNDRGQVVGISYLSDVIAPTLGVPPIGTFLWEHGKLRNIGGFGGSQTGPQWLNQKGEIVGTSLLPGDQVTRSFIWRNGHLKDLDSLGGDNVYVHTINDEGIATGYSDIPPGTPVFGHPVIWKHDHVIDLGAPAPGFNCAAGESVNSHEQVVGNAGCNQDGSGYPFLWEKSNPIVDLNTLLEPGTQLQVDFAVSINNRGEIAAGCETPTGDPRACLLVPLDDAHEWRDEATDGLERSAVAKVRSSSRRIDPSRAREGRSIPLLRHDKR